MKLSNEERNEVRKAITSHPDWKAYRKPLNITSADLSSSDKCIEVAEDLGLNWVAIASGREGNHVVREAVDVTPAGYGPDDHEDDLDRHHGEEPEPAIAPAEPAPADSNIENLFNEAAVTENPAPRNIERAKTAMETLLEELSANASVDPAQVEEIVRRAIQPIEERINELSNTQPKILVQTEAGADVGSLPAIRHETAEELLKGVNALRPKGLANVWLTGPMGSGKTTGAQQCAEALGLEFGFHGAMLMEHQLTGFVDAGGKYHETVFVRLYRNGGLCLLDEIDGGSDEARLALNAALANGIMSLPNGEIVKRHPSFVCLAAGNTWGTGATTEYVGRSRIDAAFLDRFAIKLDWGYDENLERQIAGNAEWTRRVQAARKQAVKKGVKTPITPRHSIAGAALIAAGYTSDEAAKITYLAGLSKDAIRQIEGENSDIAQEAA